MGFEFRVLSDEFLPNSPIPQLMTEPYCLLSGDRLCKGKIWASFQSRTLLNVAVFAN